MANELRRLYNFQGGLVEDNPLASGAVALNSAGLAAIPAVAATEYIPITFDPDGLEGSPFVKWITAHTAGATTATITAAGQEGTTARAVSRDIPWVLGATVLDLEKPSVSLRATSAQAIAATTWTSINFQSEAAPGFDYFGLHDTVTNNTRITFDRVGPWLVGGQFTISNVGATTATKFGRLSLNGGASYPQGKEITPHAAGIAISFDFLAPIWATAVGDYVELQVYVGAVGLPLLQDGATPMFWAVKL